MKFTDLFGAIPNLTGGLSTEHYLALQRVDKQTMREIIEPELREQIAREDNEFQNTWVCPRTHAIGMNGCDYCDGFIDGLDVAAAIARPLEPLNAYPVTIVRVT